MSVICLFPGKIPGDAWLLAVKSYNQKTNTLQNKKMSQILVSGSNLSLVQEAMEKVKELKIYYRQGI